MALDLHSKVKVQNILEVDLTKEFVFFKVSYKVNRGRKIYTLWALPEDLDQCGIFPLCVAIGGKKVLDMSNKVVYTGTAKDCTRLVKIANERWYTHK